ncbi:MAG TPA: hypothetical protein VNU01_13165 [Egibacteraceae bacterium]|nr:hypothetical protein [Egibacteraceae bacterium]
MTISVTIQVMDGMVFAADSTSTLMTSNGVAANTYDHADKILNLCKGRPLAVGFWGMGGIGESSMMTLMKDLRARFAGDVDSYEEWLLKPTCSVREVAVRVKEFIYDEKYVPVYGGNKKHPALGLAVGGYSPGKSLPERYEIIIGEDGQCQGPEEENPGSAGSLRWRGQPEAITRLVLGFGLDLPSVLHEKLGVPEDQIGPAVDLIRANLLQDPVHPAMPIQDAIDLAEFLVELTKKWVRFRPGAVTVGGPTEIAAITKHEGFKWVRRKHYYPQTLNP